MFVRCMTINRVTCRLFHFDRDGARYTPPINIHKQAETFIQFVLGISSLDEKVLGLNTAVQWEISPETGRKVKGTISVATNPEDPTKDIVYGLCEPQPESRSFTIRGRGTVVWRAHTLGPIVPPNELQTEVLVKFSWRAHDRPAEHLLLEKAVGIKGIAQMITKCERTLSTHKLRGCDENDKSGTEFLGSCIVLEAHGKSIFSFRTQRQLLGAIRDVIKGMLPTS